MLIIEKNKLGFLIILLILLSYFFGFYIREISNGAGHIDLEHHIWLVISDLKKIENYGKMEKLLLHIHYSDNLKSFGNNLFLSH